MNLSIESKHRKRSENPSYLSKTPKVIRISNALRPANGAADRCGVSPSQQAAVSRAPPMAGPPRPATMPADAGGGDLPGGARRSEGEGSSP